MSLSLLAESCDTIKHWGYILYLANGYVKTIFIVSVIIFGSE